MKYKAIKDIKVGDIVMSYNTKTHKQEPAKVTKTFCHKDIKGKKIILNDEFVATPNHPVYANNRYCRADEVKIDDYIIDNHSDIVKVKKIERREESFDVYNLEVEGHHNYFAGNILNHNKCGSYVGSDDDVIDKIAELQEQTTNWFGIIKNLVDTYYEEGDKLIGATNTEQLDTSEYSWQKAPEPGSGGEYSPTDIPEFGEGASGWDSETWDPISLLSEHGTEQIPDITGAEHITGSGAGNLIWNIQSDTGQETEYGKLLRTYKLAKEQEIVKLEGKAQDYSDAMDLYQSANVDRMKALAGAEFDMDTARTAITQGLDQGSDEIASQTADIGTEIERTQAKRGFARSGLEESMQKASRDTAKTAWENLTDTAGLDIEKAIKDYEDVVGGIDDEDTELDESLGSAEQDFNDAGIAANSALTDYNTALSEYNINMQIYSGDLTSGITEIGNLLDTTRNTAQNALTNAEANFNADAQITYDWFLANSSTAYVPSITELQNLGTNFARLYMGLQDSSWNYTDSSGWTGRKNTEAAWDTNAPGWEGQAGDDSPGEFMNWSDGQFFDLDFLGVGACLRGDVKVLMGGK